MALVKMGSEFAKKIKPIVENSPVNNPRFRPDIKEFNDGAKEKRENKRQQQRIDEKDREKQPKRIATIFAHQENQHGIKLKL